MGRWSALALVGAIGCSGGDDGTLVPKDDPTDTEDTPTTDTGPEGGFVDAAYFAIVARFGWDEDLERHVGFAEPGTGLQPMELEVVLMDTSVTNGIVDETNTCSVRFRFDASLPKADWVEPHGAWTGLDLPRDAEVVDGCRFYGLPGEFVGDAAAAIGSWSWGVGVGPLSQTVGETLQNSLPASEWAALQPYAVGGVVMSNLFAGSDLSEDGFVDAGFALGYEVDGNFEIVVGGTGNPQPIQKEFVNQPVGVATGVYEVQLGPFTPGTLLANPGP